MDPLEFETREAMRFSSDVEFVFFSPAVVSYFEISFADHVDPAHSGFFML